VFRRDPEERLTKRWDVAGGLVWINLPSFFLLLFFRYGKRFGE